MKNELLLADNQRVGGTTQRRGRAMAHSSYDRVMEHLERHGANAPLPEELRDDVDVMMRRAEGMGVELSPYMQSLLNLSGMSVEAPCVQADARAHRSVSASV
jgi:hypothetical protein